MDVIVISEEFLQVDKAVAYATNFDEKNLRAALRSAAD
jgi:hypothetical protein